MTSISTNRCCTELGRPVQDLSVSSLCSQKGVLCALTSQNIEGNELTAQNVNTVILDVLGGDTGTEESIVNDLTVTGTITINNQVLSGCAESPLEISANTGCLSIESGTSTDDILIYDTSLSRWTIGPVPPPSVDVQSSPLGSNAMAFPPFGSPGSLFTLTTDFQWVAFYGNTSNFGLSGAYDWIKVGTAATGDCFVDLTVRFVLPFFIPMPATLGVVYSFWLQNLPFRATPFTSADEARGIMSGYLDFTGGLVESNRWVGNVEAQPLYVGPPLVPAPTYPLGSIPMIRVLWGYDPLSPGAGGGVTVGPNITGVVRFRYRADVDGPPPV